MLRPNKGFNPVIKWSGSKRKIAPTLSLILPNTSCYFEPFVGSGAMLPFRPSKKGIAGDIIVELIALWKSIQNTPELTAKEYEYRWNRLQNEGHTAYYDIRTAFNETRNPHDFLFLTRTCVNGLIRFNKKGDFNNSLHHTRPGIAPMRLRKLIYQWHFAIKHITFIADDYRQTLEKVQKDDLVFLDPPYGDTKGRYLPNAFNFNEFYRALEKLNSIGAKWVLTFDGKAGKRFYNTTPPFDIYKFKFGLPTGNSPFTKLMKTSLDSVTESVYLNFEPPIKAFSQIINFRQEKTSSSTNLNMKQGRLFN